MDDVRDSFSKLKKKIKRPLKWSRDKPDRTGPGASGERVDSTGSLPRPEPRVVAGGGRERDGNGTNADGRRARSTDRSPKPVSAGIENDEREASHMHSRLDLDVEVAVESGEVERVGPSPSTPPIPQSEKPDST